MIHRIFHHKSDMVNIYNSEKQYIFSKVTSIRLYKRRSRGTGAFIVIILPERALNVNKKLYACFTDCQKAPMKQQARYFLTW